MTGEKKTSAKKIVGIIGNVLLWAFLLFSVLITVLVFASQNNKDGVPVLFGKSLITIESPSMEPTFKVGDMILLDALDEDARQTVKVGDIITYHAPIDINNDGQIGDINTHRIVSIDEKGGITTQGDNKVTNPTADNYTLSYTDIIGISDEGSAIPGVGNIINFLRSSLGFFLCIVLPLILFFIYELYRFIALVVSERAKRAPVAKETEEEIKQRAIAEYLEQQKAAAEAAEKAEASTESDSAEEAPAEEISAE